MNGKAILSFAEVDSQLAQLHGRISKERDSLLGHIGHLQSQVNELKGQKELPLKEKDIPWRDAAMVEFTRHWEESSMTRKIFIEKTKWDPNVFMQIFKGSLGGGKDSVNRKPRRLTEKHAFAIDLAFNLQGPDSFGKYVGLE